jgi:hypothetical protein
MGYYRGILRQLDTMEASLPPGADFVRRLRTQAQAYQFDAMQRVLLQALAASGQGTGGRDSPPESAA